MGIRLMLAKSASDLRLALLVASFAIPRTAAAAVVGTGIADDCTETALDAALGCGVPSGDPPTSICTAGGAISFNCGTLPATITLTSQKTLSVDTSIDGGGLVTFSGGGTTAALSVNPGVTVAIANLTISGGFARGFSVDGSAISNAGTLTVAHSTLSGNYAAFGGAIFNSGTLALSDSMLSGNSAVEGGGIDNVRSGTAEVTHSVFSTNSTTEGGAIYNSGMVTARYSTFARNSASFGGAVFNSNTFTSIGNTFSGNHATDGGAISDSGITVTVVDSTFSGNSAVKSGGAVENNSGDFIGANDTFAGNSAEFGGAVSSDSSEPLGSVLLTNTILAASAGGNCSISSDATLTDGGNNIDDGATCGFSGAGCASTAGQSFCAANPVLDPAGSADNGGPTETIALAAGSPAIDAGNDAVCAAPPVSSLDQRGFGRPGRGATHCSIGAVEYDASAAVCIGDCAGTGQVTIADLLLMVNIALGDDSVASCTAGDVNHDGQITIVDLLAAVNQALTGCLSIG